METSNRFDTEALIFVDDILPCKWDTYQVTLKAWLYRLPVLSRDYSVELIQEPCGTFTWWQLGLQLAGNTGKGHRQRSCTLIFPSNNHLFYLLWCNSQSTYFFKMVSYIFFQNATVFIFYKIIPYPQKWLIFLLLCGLREEKSFWEKWYNFCDGQMEVDPSSPKKNLIQPTSTIPTTFFSYISLFCFLIILQLSQSG